MIKIDTDKGTVEIVENEITVQSWPIGSAEGFREVSRAWLRSGWDAKYVYGFSWMGRPVIQLPEDMIRIQEVIFDIQPDVLIETGIAHGGSLIFYSSLFKAMGKGRVVGVDIEIRSHNREAIEAHPLNDRVTMIEGSSVDPAIVNQVKQQVRPGETCLILLDSNHTRSHVLEELHAYCDLVRVGSYIVACDGIMKEVVGAPRTSPEWITDNPQVAVEEFLKQRSDFVLCEPPFPFNEGLVKERVTYWPNAFLKRVS